MREAVVVPYDPTWADRFETLRSRIWEGVRDIAVSIEHVGSTAVIGLAAKPIIDMTVVVGSRADVPIAIERLGKLGYDHRGDLGIPGRETFLAPADLPAHHLYLCAQGSTALANHLTVRDCLRTHPEAARLYGALKEHFAVQFRDDIDGYVEAKTEFLISILAQAGFAPDVLADIVSANRKR